ncbi:unnamed protein product [Callosobruchus maculatus]|uniref:Uncharacterized protein n=1 Tax=Callosobruchus maculatus TaxID=64391 RepID=A0A653DTX9_CALMS|nr:unnamed protein product [Callosobruchus maculatus]
MWHYKDYAKVTQFFLLRLGYTVASNLIKWFLSTDRHCEHPKTGNKFKVGARVPLFLKINFLSSNITKNAT